ncbi:FeoB-associated Cys-rich membrane protein [Listeria booriae]|uniref:FeoB-associated Cys-rich membrane protein n=1 Tax=Listeria booriae TaxID=1552123 RepID=A0A7X1BZL5_9LIST|nr:FeoB-associated Cys-rich membrane protein [Listeria booriae]MBC1356734.1 FeoB-associated Cys-rich membrane protein [Listeria booriae]MBC1372879.1 FeoB-associated Cys-rich membrane protein [Listeria booriae]MBC2003622.1 FeoB-associated Cys-rich membrane protein [Listeria booriae]
MVNFIIGGLIFGYAAYALVTYIRKSKQGKCGGCDLEKSCDHETQQ